MKGNQFYTAFGIVTAVLFGAAGFYCYKGHSSFKDAGGEFETRRTNLLRLKRSKPYPDEENLGKIEKLVTEYDGEIKGLFQVLDRFQQPLNTNLNDAQFPQILKSKIGAFRDLAKKKGMKLSEESEFYMAMDAYRNTLPNAKAVPLLDYQLGAIEYLLNTLVEAGATELIHLDRELLPVEVAASGGTAEGGAPSNSSSVVAKYPVNLTFETRHPAFQKFVNQITNDDKYFFILRALRVDNSEKDGVERGGSDDSGPRYVNPATGQEAPKDLVDKIPSDLEVAEQIAWMKENGDYVLQSSDARILLGNESLRVFMVIDVVRFTDASVKSVAGEKKEMKNGGSGTGKEKEKK